MTTSGTTSVPVKFWVGLVAIVIYLALAAGLANLLTELVKPADPAVDLLLGHLPIPILIVAGVLFVRWSGWGERVWRTPSALETRPRRWWMLAIPLLLLVGPILTLTSTPADNDWNVGSVLIVALVFTCVGFGEELYFRGILRASIRAHHGETLAFVATSLLFGLGHSFSSFFHGLPLGFIALQVGATALLGAVYYGAFLATGRLWVPIALHALADFSLLIASGTLAESPSADINPPQASAWVEIGLWILAAAVLVSCIRRDLRARKERRAGEAPSV